ncbi:alpha-1-inhibitor 3-like [Homarus americanus]|uniref:alpha-1-inhibitor 3-like n=1 Tax=Homarus americanus TaxID=6706 RepID=UPI001C484090|nr:alpha-1-inhibitor 3-like [Homarus americanus]
MAPMILTAAVFTLAVTITFCSGNYIITTPREWVTEQLTQVCVWVTDPSAPAGSLQLNVKYTRTHTKKEDEVIVVVPSVTIPVPAGKTEFCEDLYVPKTAKFYYGSKLYMTGQVAGFKINQTVPLSLDHNRLTTIIQTDKYLYKPGQKVQMRMISYTGPFFNISSQPYREVWVQTPSRTRIAQWLNVDNSAGLVHLDMTLADEPEQGVYTIIAENVHNSTTRTSFKVEEYVLPRFELIVTAPKLLLATDKTFTFTVCAKYTFGEPVNGNLTVEVSNMKSRECHVSLNKTYTFTGCKDIEVFSEDIKMIGCRVNTVRAKAILTEEGTGVVLSGVTRASVSRRAVDFKTIFNDNYMKPNLPYTLKVKAELPDKSPAGGLLVELCTDESCTNITTPQDGVITTVLPPSSVRNILMKALNSRAMMYESSFSTTIEHYFSPSNSSLLIHAPEGRLKCSGNDLRHSLPVLFSANNQPRAFITVQVVSRKQIQYSNTQEYDLIGSPLPGDAQQLQEPLSAFSSTTTTGVIYVSITLPATASPNARVIVWYTRADGEMVTDTRELEVDKCLPNTVDLSWSEEQAQPGELTTLSLSGAPRSLCSFSVVDKSVQLLRGETDHFSVESLFSSINYYKISKWNNAQSDDQKYCRNQLGKGGEKNFYNYYSPYVDALKMFDESGLYVFSNLKVETRPCKEGEQPYSNNGDRSTFDSLGIFGTRIHGGKTPAVQSSVSAAPERDSVETVSVDSPRTYFPETWLWDLTVLPVSGISNQEVTLPDTITQWIGKAVCVHPQEGLGVSQQVNITTFTPFFVDLTLPPSVKRGEILPVKISVFNYLDISLPVSVALLESVEYEIIPSGPGPLGQNEMCVNSQKKMVHTVKIKPSVIGDVNITVTAFVDHQYSGACGVRDTTVTKSDTLIKPITVEAEGFPREKTSSAYICSRDIKNGIDAHGTWTVGAPPAIVEGSDRAWVTAVGDLLSLTLENLGNLIRMPSGCGEQNLLNFAPNIFILQYLNATGQDNRHTAKKLVDYMRTGYQRQLLYRRDDGSFSGFGNADDSGSTWLTAFVLKSFAQAEPYIYIDREELARTKRWLLSTQNATGCFSPVGKVFNKGLKGGIAGKDSLVPLTAYVMISLLEAGLTPSGHPVSAAVRCLTADASQDPYTQALKAYALALGRQPGADQAILQLTKQAVTTKTSMHWDIWSGQSKSSSLMVETAGYAILAMMTENSRRYEYQARRIVKWISSQRNGRGGFVSTQDTVVALQAMALYESRFYEGDLNMVATVKAGGLEHSFAVAEHNKFLTQLVPLPNLPTSVSLSIVGQGCTIFQSVLRYNIPEPEASDAFSLTVTSKTEPDKTCVTKRINACASYRLSDGKSNMAIMEVNLVSGYTPEKTDLKQITKANGKVIKKYEVDGSKVSFYIDELTAEKMCVSFRTVREVDIENVKPGTVVLYDYYQPEFSISENFRLPSPDHCIYAW